MGKMVMLFLSLLFSYASNWGIIKEEISIEAEVIWSDGITSLIKEGEENYLLTHQNGWKYVLHEVSDPKVVSNKQTIGVIYWQGREFYFLELNDQGTVIHHELVTQDALVEINDFFLDEDSFYLIGSIKDYDYQVITSEKEKALEDVLIIKITAQRQIFVYALGGLKEDKGLGLMVDGDRSFLFFRKDPLTGGDFEYSGIGNNVLAIAVLDEQMNPIKEIAINDIMSLQSYCLYDNMLCFVADNQLYYFSSQLENSYKVDLKGTFHYVKMGKNGSLLLVDSTKMRLFNLVKNELIGEILNVDYKEGSYSFTNRGIFYQDFHQACILDFYWNEDRLTTLYGIVEVNEEKYTPTYNPQIYGKYQKTSRCLSKGGIEFSLVQEIEVPLEINIMNGGVYPLNYKLLFKGKAYLDGNEILNNYALQEEKEVKLDLVGANGQVTTFQFFVSHKQIMFTEDMHRIADFEVIAGEEYKLIYEIKGVDEIEKMVINGEETTDFIHYPSTNRVMVNLVAPLEYGNHQIKIDKIIYYSQNIRDTFNPELSYTLQVIKKAPLIELTNAKGSIAVSCLDNDRTVRYFEIVLTNQDKEETISYPIADSDIKIPWLVLDQEYQATLNLVYDVGSYHYQRQKLLEFSFIAKEQDMPIGQIMITRFNDSLEKCLIAFTDRFYKTSLIFSRMGDRIIFQKVESKNNYFLLASIGAVIIGAGCGYGFKRRKKTKI